MIGTIVLDFFVLVIRDILLEGIGYGVKRSYYFLRGQSYKKTKAKKYDFFEAEGFSNITIGAITFFAVLIVLLVLI